MRTLRLVRSEEPFGVGGHAALPESYNSPIIAAARLIISLEDYFLPFRNIPSVFAIGFVEGNGYCNVIPDKVELKGTFRTLDEEFRGLAHLQMKEIAKNIARRHRITERFLSEILNLPWDQVYEETSRWENVLSPITEKAMLKMLGYPKTGPFGNPIPYSNYQEKSMLSLLNVESNKTYSIEKITEELNFQINFILKDKNLKR